MANAYPALCLQFLLGERMNSVEACLVLSDAAEEEGKDIFSLSQLLRDIGIMKNFIKNPKYIQAIKNGKADIFAANQNDKVLLKFSYHEISKELMAGLIMPYLRNTIKEKERWNQKMKYESIETEGFLLTKRGIDIFRLVMGERIDDISAPPWGNQELSTKRLSKVARGMHFVFNEKVDARKDCNTCIRAKICNGYGHPCEMHVSDDKINIEILKTIFSDEATQNDNIKKIYFVFENEPPAAQSLFDTNEYRNNREKFNLYKSEAKRSILNFINRENPDSCNPQIVKNYRNSILRSIDHAIQFLHLMKIDETFGEKSK